MFQATSSLKKIKALTKRLRIIQGGSSAGKTIAILLIFIDKLQRQKGRISSVVSATVPHLRRGVVRDFKRIMEEHGYWKESRWHETTFTYTFETGSQLEFFSADSPEKVRGPRRNGDLFLNEVNLIPYETYVQLDIRTEGDIFMDYNPTNSFWVHEEIIDKNVPHDFLIVTYRDNEGLPQVIVDAIESRRANKSWFQVYGEGQLGEVEGLIYPNWSRIEAVPQEARLLRYWLDYGYTNDPTAIGGIYKWNDIYIVDELAYHTGLLNNQIADILLNVERVPIAADSAEPKSNDELKLRGLTIIPARKGSDSVRSGIQLVQQEKIFVTHRSVNIWKERCNYIWLTDPKTGKPYSPNEPIPTFNHHMDGIRYGFETLLGALPEKILSEQRFNFERNYHRQIMNKTQ